MVAIVTRSLNDGFLPAFAIALGVATMHLFYFPLAAFSFSLKGPIVENVTFALQLIGACYIMWMGIKGLRSLDKNVWAMRKRDDNNRFLFENYITGVAINLSNPYVILFYVGLIPSIMDFNTFSVPDVALATVVTFTAIAVVLGLECVLASQFRYILRDMNMARLLNIVSSVAMVGIGVFIFLNAFDVWNVTFGIANAAS